MSRPYEGCNGTSKNMRGKSIHTKREAIGRITSPVQRCRLRHFLRCLLTRYSRRLNCAIRVFLLSYSGRPIRAALQILSRPPRQNQRLERLSPDCPRVFLGRFLTANVCSMAQTARTRPSQGKEGWLTPALLNPTPIITSLVASSRRRRRPGIWHR